MEIFYETNILYFTLIVNYTLFSLVGFYFDYNLIYEHNKIKNRSSEEYLELFKYSAPCVARNLYIYSYPYIYGFIYLHKLIHKSYTEYYDNYLLSLIQFIIYYYLFRIISDIVFYSAHRLLHTKYFYKYHKKHHEIKNPTMVTTLYMSVPDLYISNLSPLAISCLLLNFNLVTAQIFVILQLIYSVCIAHGGYKNLSEDHNFHHTLFKYNYGSSSLKITMDKIFKTEYKEK